jgi:hypothetical protein
VGAYEPRALAWGEATVKYHPGDFWCLTWAPERGREQWLVGSLTGAVASQKVTEAREGSLSLIGNQASSAMA